MNATDYVATWCRGPSQTITGGPAGPGARHVASRHAGNRLGASQSEPLLGRRDGEVSPASRERAKLSVGTKLGGETGDRCSNPAKPRWPARRRSATVQRVARLWPEAQWSEVDATEMLRGMGTISVERRAEARRSRVSGLVGAAVTVAAGGASRPQQPAVEPPRICPCCTRPSARSFPQHIGAATSCIDRSIDRPTRDS